MTVVYLDDRKIEVARHNNGTLTIVGDTEGYLQGEFFFTPQDLYAFLKQDQEADKEYRMER